MLAEKQFNISPAPLIAIPVQPWLFFFFSSLISSVMMQYSLSNTSSADSDLALVTMEYLSLLNCLFRTVRSVILSMFYNRNKSKNIVPGFICVPHTFGRSLAWNPHIHWLLTEGGFSDNRLRIVKHFSYQYLRTAFQTTFLNEMQAQIDACILLLLIANHKNQLCLFKFYFFMYFWVKINSCLDIQLIN
ncbi:MAG TPA: transposase [Candidatus Pelethocola excrementipullorum]|nr:transposase [Candidatus Pelethocola excrementipullorum]